VYPVSVAKLTARISGMPTGILQIDGAGARIYGLALDDFVFDDADISIVSKMNEAAPDSAGQPTWRNDPIEAEPEEQAEALVPAVPAPALPPPQPGEQFVPILYISVGFSQQEVAPW
jgi:hypothetical protein